MENAVATAEQTQSDSYMPSDAPRLSRADPQQLAERIADGALLREIAVEYGVTAAAVSWYLRSKLPIETWQQIRELSIAARLEKSTQAMEQAADVLELARARESTRLWMWRAEREHPHIYGQRPSTAIQVSGDAMTVQVVSYSSNKEADAKPVIGNDNGKSS